MKTIAVILLMLSTPVMANHGGLWHEPQPRYEQPRYSQADESDRAQQREYERQQREQQRQQQQEQKPYWTR